MRIDNHFDTLANWHLGLYAGTQHTSSRILTVTLERQKLVALPGAALGGASFVVVVALSAQTAVFAACRGEAAHFAVLVHGVADPVDSGVAADDLVHRVDHDHLEVFVHRVLIQPVGVQHAQGTAAACRTLLRDGAQVAGELQLLHTLVHGLTVADTLVDRPLTASAAHARAVDAEALLGLVAEPASLVGSCGASHTAHGRQLAVLPDAHALEEAEHIALLLLPQLFDVLVSPHRAGLRCTPCASEKGS
mmetsp:Transcript_16026/g.25872  ORF Transcript_16026/g.25872 Transcript_16026/m.25872 type:complete len:249 (-) Transcript_16026:5-751(-)